jgi:hypothetical protein
MEPPLPVSLEFSCTHARKQGKTEAEMKARPSNLIPFAPFDGVPPLHKLDQKMMRKLRNLADRTGCTVERCIREGFADFVTRYAAEEELDRKIIAFRETSL